MIKHSLTDIQAKEFHSYGLKTLDDIIDAIRYMYNNPNEDLSKLKKLFRISRNTTNNIFHSTTIGVDIFGAFDSTVDIGSVLILTQLYKSNIPDLLFNDTINQEGLCERCKVAIGRLNDRYKKLLIFRFYCGYTNKELETMLKLSPRSLESEVKKALNRLKDKESGEFILRSDLELLRGTEFNLRNEVGNSVDVLDLSIPCREVLRSLGINTIGEFIKAMETNKRAANRASNRTLAEVGSILDKRHVRDGLRTELFRAYENCIKFRVKVSPLELYDKTLRDVMNTISIYNRRSA